jgi:hypothetical protein
MSLPTIESSFATHTSKGIQGFDHPKYPAMRVALEVFNATEGYLWVRHSVFSKDGYLKCFLAVHSRFWFSIWHIYVYRCRSRLPQLQSVSSRSNTYLLYMLMTDHIEELKQP